MHQVLSGILFVKSTVETFIVALLPKLLRIAWGVVSIMVEVELFLMSAISFRDLQKRPMASTLRFVAR